MMLLKKIVYGFIGGSLPTALFLMYCWDRLTILMVLLTGVFGAVMNCMELLRGGMDDY